MSITTFQGFLATAGLHHGLLVDLCAETGLITRAKLLTYMERHGISPVEKDRLIERYCRTSILYDKNRQCLPVIQLIEQHNAGLEQEIVALPEWTHISP